MKKIWEKKTGFFEREKIDFRREKKLIFQKRKNGFSDKTKDFQREKISFHEKLLIFSERKDSEKENNKLRKKTRRIKFCKKAECPQPFSSPTCTWGDAAERCGFPNVIFILTV